MSRAMPRPSPVPSTSVQTYVLNDAPDTADLNLIPVEEGYFKKETL